MVSKNWCMFLIFNLCQLWFSKFTVAFILVIKRKKKKISDKKQNEKTQIYNMCLVTICRQGGELVPVEMMFGYMSIMKFIFSWIEEETLGHWDCSTGKGAFHIVWDLSLIPRLLRESWLPWVVFWPPIASLHEQFALHTCTCTHPHVNIN